MPPGEGVDISCYTDRERSRKNILWASLGSTHLLFYYEPLIRVKIMSKFYSPRDYDTIGFGNNRRHVPISDAEKRKRAGIGKANKKVKEHFNKNWDKDLWD